MSSRSTAVSALSSRGRGAGGEGRIPIPRWAIIAGSIAIAGHLLALLFLVLAAPSGPWPNTVDGEPFMGPAPDFAVAMNSATGPSYLRFLHLTHNYHFTSNKIVEQPFGAYLEATLKDKDGNVIDKLRIPDENASGAVRAKQVRLAQVVARDDSIPFSEVTQSVPAPDQEIPKVHYWEYDSKNGRLLLTSMDEIDVQKKREERMELFGQGRIGHPRILRPTEGQLRMLRSYSRYLRRAHNAASVELTRYSQIRIPADLLKNDLSPEQLKGIEQALSTQVSQFGDVEKLPRQKRGAQ